MIDFAKLNPRICDVNYEPDNSKVVAETLIPSRELTRLITSISFNHVTVDT